MHDDRHEKSILKSITSGYDCVRKKSASPSATSAWTKFAPQCVTRLIIEALVREMDQTWPNLMHSCTLRLRAFSPIAVGGSGTTNETARAATPRAERWEICVDRRRRVAGRGRGARIIREQVTATLSARHSGEASSSNRERQTRQ